MSARIPIPRSLSTAPFTFVDAIEAGLHPKRVRAADLAHPFHNVHSARAIDSVAELCRAYMLRMPDQAFFSSATAALLRGAPMPRSVELDPRLHVSRQAPDDPVSGRGVIGHSVTLMGNDWNVHRGLPTATPERIWCELGALLRVPDLVSVGDYFIHHRAPVTSIEELARATSLYPSRRGRINLRTALGLLDDRAESRRESILRVEMINGGLVGFVSNYGIRTPVANYRADFAFVKQKVIVEYEGEHHADIAQWRRDMTRRSRLEAAGWFVIQVNADDLKDPRELIARIRSVLAKRS